MNTLGITGATGLIGARFLKHWLESHPDTQVRCSSRSGSVLPRHEQLEWLQGDLSNEADCREFVEGLDAVIHLAHANSPATSNRHWSSDLAANLVPTLTLLEALRQRKTDQICHLVFASSGGAVYGRKNGDGTTFAEADPCHPLSPYGIQKLALEHYLATACVQGWLRATVLRLSNVYGTLLAVERRQGLIGVALARILSNQPVRVYGPLSNVRDYLHVDDVARAFGAALLPCGQSGAKANFRVFNIGAGRGHSVAEVLELIERVTGKNVRTEVSGFGAAAFSSLPTVVLSIEKAGQELLWAPQIELEEGVTSLWKQNL